MLRQPASPQSHCETETPHQQRSAPRLLRPHRAWRERTPEWGENQVGQHIGSLGFLCTLWLLEYYRSPTNKLIYVVIQLPSYLHLAVWLAQDVQRSCRSELAQKHFGLAQQPPEAARSQSPRSPAMLRSVPAPRPRRCGGLAARDRPRACDRCVSFPYILPASLDRRLDNHQRGVYRTGVMFPLRVLV